MALVDAGLCGDGIGPRHDGAEELLRDDNETWTPSSPSWSSMLIFWSELSAEPVDRDDGAGDGSGGGGESGRSGVGSEEAVLS